MLHPPEDLAWLCSLTDQAEASNTPSCCLRQPRGSPVQRAAHGHIPSFLCVLCLLDGLPLLYSLTDEPEANDTITLFVTAFGLEGNSIDVEPLLQYDKGVHNLTQANYGHQYQTRINVTGSIPLSPFQSHYAVVSS